MGIEHLRSENEKIHANLFKLHEQLSAAHDIAHQSAVAIYALGGYSDTRQEYASVLDAVEAARDAIMVVLLNAAEARTNFIRKSGCDASCNGQES